MCSGAITGVDLLLKAAEFIERREREAEHGYASTPPVCGILHYDILKTRKKYGGSRTSHNELEKNRRAHLRGCLETLKGLVPLGPDATRHTTLGLLTRAKTHIETLEERDKRFALLKDKLNREQRYLLRRLEALCAESEAMLRRSLANENGTNSSEESDANNISATIGFSIIEAIRSSLRKVIGSSAFLSLEDDDPAASPSDRPTAYTPVSETDEVDVIGYTSAVSEDEPLSGRSSSDSGVVVSASNLIYCEMEIN